MATVLTPRHQEMLRQCSVPVVVVGQRSQNVPCVYHDDFNAARELMDCLIQRGRRKLVYIGVTELDVAVGLNRRQGVRAALTQAGLDPDIPSRQSSFTVEGGRAAMEALLEECPDVDGVMCATDLIALGAMEALREAGKRLPEDVSVAGIDDSWAGVHVSPKLTTAHFYYEDCGAEAARLLLSMADQKHRDDAPVRQTMLGYTVVQRESV